MVFVDPTAMNGGRRCCIALRPRSGGQLFRRRRVILEILTQAAAAARPGGFGEIWSHIVADFSNITEPAALAAFVQVLMIDIVLAGDNAIIVGALAAGLPADQRKKVILIGVLAALVLRIAFAPSRHAVDADCRSDLRRRPAADLGRLEDVARTARRRAFGRIARDRGRRTFGVEACEELCRRRTERSRSPMSA